MIEIDTIEKIQTKNKVNKRRDKQIVTSFEYDPHFWAIIPAININLHSSTLEFEWLCFAMYIDFDGKIGYQKLKNNEQR